MPLINFGRNKIPRCAGKACRTYVNPFIKFLKNGNWKCNMCNHINATPKHYRSQIDEDGQRIDIEERPELTHSCYEFMAGQE